VEEKGSFATDNSGSAIRWLEERTSEERKQQKEVERGRRSPKQDREKEGEGNDVVNSWL